MFYFNTSASAKKEQDSDKDEAEIASATATRSEIVRYVLCKGSNCFEDNDLHTNPATICAL